MYGLTFRFLLLSPGDGARGVIPGDGGWAWRIRVGCDKETCTSAMGVSSSGGKRPLECKKFIFGSMTEKLTCAIL